MLIYEVNAVVQLEMAEAYEAWLADHIRQMLATGTFTRAVLYRVEDQGTGARRWTTHYHAATQADLDAYFSQHAAALRGNGVQRFGESVTLERRVLVEEMPATLGAGVVE